MMGRTMLDLVALAMRHVGADADPIDRDIAIVLLALAEAIRAFVDDGRTDALTHLAQHAQRRERDRDGVVLARLRLGLKR